MPGLDKDLALKYGISKKAWAIQRKRNKKRGKSPKTVKRKSAKPKTRKTAKAARKLRIKTMRSKRTMAKRKSRKKATRRRSSKSDLGLGTALAGTAGVITGLAGVNYLRTKQAPTSQEISNMISGITGKLGRTEIIIPMGLGLLMSAKKINVPMINKSTAAVLGTGIFLGTAALAATTPQSPGFNPLTGQIGTQSRFRNMRAAPADSNNLMRRR